MDHSTLLFDVNPLLIEQICRILDSGDDRFGWRELAARIVQQWLDVRRLEQLAAGGRSPTRELLWSWALQNGKVADLTKVLEDMGHQRALQLFLNQAASSTPRKDTPTSLGSTAKGWKEPCLQEKITPNKEHSFGVSCVLSQKATQRYTITYNDVIAGTGHFHDDMKIAEGSFSDTYKGNMGKETFAVKLFKLVNNTSWKDRWELFRREMEVHHLYQHPNILDLLGCFSDDGNYCLVYPYLPNGSLHYRLHDRDTVHPLSCQQRLAVIKGTANAVHHLHVAKPCPLICGNISSGNILLDDNLQAKLSNFGTARLRPPPLGQSCTITLDAKRHGDLGYLPQEYLRDGKLSFSLDVYSFGMVVMETITGREVVEEMHERSLLVRDVLSAEVEDSGRVDSCMRFLDWRAGPWPYPVSLGLIRLALVCTEGRYRSRPNMEAVLRELSQLLPLPGYLANNRPRDFDDGESHNTDPPHALVDPSSPPTTPAADPVPDSAVPWPCECSQSEVTFLSGGSKPGMTGGETAATLSANLAVPEAAGGGEGALDLYGSWPVQCGCWADSGAAGCEDCRANGFTSNPAAMPLCEASYTSWNIVENPVKERLKAKLDLYKQGLLKTEELLSMT